MSRELDLFGKAVGIDPRWYESEEVYRARLDNVMKAQSRLPTLRNIASAATETIADWSPVGANQTTIRRDVAKHWLRQDRPGGFFKRASWVFSIAWEMWKR